MKVIVNRSGNVIRIPEIRMQIPCDGRRYMLEDVWVERYRNFLEVVDVEKEKEINVLNNKILLLEKEKERLERENKTVHEHENMLSIIGDNINAPKLDFLYSFHFDDDEIDGAVERLRRSIKSIIFQNVRICICNTSKKCIKKKIKDLGKINYYHEFINLETYCKPKTINLGVRKFIKTDYFFLSDIDLYYHPDYVKNVGIFLKNIKEPFRLVTYNHNLGPKIIPNSIEDCYEYYTISVDPTRTTVGISPGNGLVHLDSFNVIGGFDERYVGYGPEDADFNYRIQKICKYIEINLKSFNTYHLYHSNKTWKSIQYGNNFVLYEQLKKQGKKLKFIKSGQIKVPTKLLKVNEPDIKEVII